jgi:choline dehydrogenase-like flavoprotein
MQPYFTALDGAGCDDGIIPITTHAHQYAITEAFIESSCATGLPRHERMPDVGQKGSGYLHFNIDRKGKRRSAATAFLKPLYRRTNVCIKTGIQVDRLVFEGKRATAVICHGKGGQVIYSAQREIVLCAGTLESPLILQRSGIGPAALLEELGIAVIRANPHVGANLREHLILGISFEVDSWQDTENRQYAGLPLLGNVLRYLITRKGPMAQSPCHAATFICSDERLPTPDIQLMFSPYSRDGNDFSDSPGVSIAGYPMYPQSTGEIHIRASDPAVPALIKPNYLSHAYDRQSSIAAVRHIRNIAAQPPLASRLLQEMPLSAAAQTDAEILALYKQNGMPGFHATGTCAMGLDSTAAVVDGDACVHGVDGLRVVDCSIFPQMLSGVTNATVMAIAMAAAQRILDRHPV